MNSLFSPNLEQRVIAALEMFFQIWKDFPFSIPNVMVKIIETNDTVNQN